MPRSKTIFGTLLLAATLAFCIGPIARAQTDDDGFKPIGALSDLINRGPTGKQLTVSGRFIVDESKSQGYLQIRAEVIPGWHIYSTTQPAGVGAPLRTKIIVSPSEDFRVTSEFRPNRKPTVKNLEYVEVPIEEHSGSTVWSAAIELAPGVDASQLVIQGELDGQVCEDDGVCMPLSSLDTRFVAKLDASDVAPSPAQASSTENTGDSGATVNVASAELLQNVGIGFIAGLLLNLMPCVLPVIGLKIMSFASQAGEARGRVIALNLYFVAGLVSVFLALAALAAFLGWGWGQQFQRPEFSIALVSIVFVFALSFLGVWEIPIPGFVGSGKAMGAAQREGPIGAYLKGVLTTLLATPCSGPLIVPTLAWALKQPKPVIFATFASMGLGMGFPYLMISMFPRLINLLPKPGAWMDTFKQIMGFVLLATVVWIFSFLNADYFVPTLALLFSLWAACWWIGRTSVTAEASAKFKAYLSAGAFAAVVGWLSFHLLLPGVEWPEYSPQKLANLQERNVTVLVDFTADW